MTNTILTSNQDVWPNITAAIRRAKQPCYAAIAYMGQKGSRMLPLKTGGKLIVDASIAAVKSGQTDPKELSILYRKGVEIYSLSGLHAKVVVADNDVFIGSANVSRRSARHLTEAVFKTNDTDVRAQALEFINSIKAKQLGPAELKTLEGYYSTPTNVPQAVEDGADKAPAVYVYFLDWEDDYDEHARTIVAKGRAKAERKRQNVRKHTLDEFQCDGKTVPSEGAYVIHVMRERGTLRVYPPGTVVHVESDPFKLRSFVWSEIRNVPSVLLSKLPIEYKRQIGMRSGKRAGLNVADLEQEILRNSKTLKYPISYGMSAQVFRLLEFKWPRFCSVNVNRRHI